MKFDMKTNSTKLQYNTQKMYEKVQNFTMGTRHLRSICTSEDERLIYACEFGSQLYIMRNNELVSEENAIQVLNNKISCLETL